MYKIAVVGDYDSIYGFAALGLDIFPVKTREEAGETLHRLAAGEYGDYLYYGELVRQIDNMKLKDIRNRSLPAIIQIPGVAGNTGAGVARREEDRWKQAVGSDILFGND